jgi:purine-binding chemotaxis protein CheW
MNHLLPTSDQEGLFSIKGSLDGEQDEDFIVKTQFIGLHVGKELFYIPLAKVSEIIMLEPIRFVPGGSEFIEGVINLRGTILPVINLGQLTGLDHHKPSPSTRIIIVKHLNTTAGLIVDGLSTVIGLTKSDIEDKSLGGTNNSINIISQIAKHNDSISGIFDIEKILQIAGDLKEIEENEENEENEEGS